LLLREDGGRRGNVYVADTDKNRVWMLAPGSITQVVLPLRRAGSPVRYGGCRGNAYATDSGNRRVLKLAVGSDTQTVLPFTDLGTRPAWRWTAPAPSTAPTTTTIIC